MTKEALTLALEAIEYVHDTGDTQTFDMCYAKPALAALKEALAQPEQEPVGKLQEATAERAWFTIAELNAWADKKLSENPNWVMPKDEPERDEPPPQRTWVGLTYEDMVSLQKDLFDAKGEIVLPTTFAMAVEAKLKEKNT